MPEFANKPVDGSRRGDRLFRHVAWRNSYWVIALIALSFGLLIVVGSPLLDRLVDHLHRPVFPSDWLAGILAALLIGATLVRVQMRRREMQARMQIIEDVNHHVRNALTSITFSTALLKDKELNALVKDASDRIDWVLTEVLPNKPLDAGDPELPPRWRPGRQLGVLRRRDR